MEELFHSITKTLAHNIVVHIYSIPNFSIESFITSLICLIHILLIIEVNSLAKRIIRKYSTKLRLQRIIKEEISRPSSRFSLQSADTNVKIHHNLRKYYENHSPFLINSKKLSKIPEKNAVADDDSNWEFSSSRFDRERYQKIDQILSISPSDYIKKDKEKKIHENELRHCLKSLTTLLECSVASRMSTTSLAKSVSILRTHLKSSDSCENILESRKDMEKNRSTTDKLYQTIESSLSQSAREEGIRSHGDITKTGSLDGNLSVYSSPSDTCADLDLNSETNIVEII